MVQMKARQIRMSSKLWNEIKKASTQSDDGLNRRVTASEFVRDACITKLKNYDWASRWNDNEVNRNLREERTRTKAEIKARWMHFQFDDGFSGTHWRLTNGRSNLLEKRSDDHYASGFPVEFLTESEAIVAKEKLNWSERNANAESAQRADATASLG